MGRSCRVCGRIRANERFSERGHKQGVCKECHSEVHSLQRSVRQERGHTGVEREIAGLLEQTRITETNMARLMELATSGPEQAKKMAALALEVARIAPERKSRPDRLRQSVPDLIDRLREYRLAVWEEKRVKRPERLVRNRLEAQGLAETKMAARVVSDTEEPLTDPWNYYEPDSVDAFYWDFIRDDGHILPSRSKRRSGNSRAGKGEKP